MKKLLVLVLVLGFSGLASAVPVVFFADEDQTITATPGSVVVLNIETVEILTGIDLTIEVDGGATITGAMSIADCGDYGWDPSLSGDPLGLGTDTVEILAGSFLGNSGPVVGYVAITYGGGQVIVSGGPLEPPEPMPGPEPPSYFSHGVVTIIPEPGTILLLGLGGLMLRKRKGK